ncbi:MAG: MBL fold metallo-hydrolase [Epsilonproteobacteria bacterium]|nr:MAG: MBL fold metallo-hydrolase [Campylobacterota bacterium]
MNQIEENGVTLKIHKGTDEIGGSCIELSTDNTTILLDYGTPLKKESEQVILDKPIDAILISHPHQDHYGELVNIDTSTPVYCGELSLELMNATKIFTGSSILENNFHTFQAWEKFEVGDFKITPYLVDHSAPDAYAFLVEVNKKRILYSGDFRAHGRKPKLFNKMIQDPLLKGVDILLMEGTMLQRSNDDFPDEQSVEDEIFQTIKEHEQITFMIGSSQNIDSIVSAYRACKRAGKVFVVDMYTAWVLEKLKIVSNSVPNMSWGDVKVLRSYGKYYYDKISENPSHFGDFKSKIYKDGNNIQLEEIKLSASKYFLKISPSFIDKSIQRLNLNNANIIYSQWLGYLEEEFSDIKTVNLYKKLQDKYNWVYAHTSGHADLRSLKKFASSIHPKILIPIHTEYKKEFENHFHNVTVLVDNKDFSINENFLTSYQVNHLNKIFEEDLDAKYEEAKQLVLNTENLSISVLQRKLQLGYNETANFLEELNDAGVIEWPAK